MHCEGLLFFIKASTAQKGASKDVALKDNTNEMINKHVLQAKPDKLWTSFNQICCNIQAIFEHYGINSSDLNMQQLLQMVGKYKHEDKVQIQVMRDKSGDIAGNVENELTVRLESRMGVKFKTCRNESEIEPTKPLLVLCVAGTRIGSDATYSIQDIAREYYRNTALLIIHNKEEHSLPVKSSSDVLTDQKFEDLGGIFDFGYSKDMGIYGCKMNNRSFDDLTLFITRHAAEKG
ncbi:uncharacterized protein LOC123545579 [Mercenaria mercenaria]|uniref:uncharacterized protein LOC123545579 n=1 Tax=Mercenaria mercenaria TaxID=6596 RepID=UPI00234F5FA2|nr:uncharacterized protein LOC123545579 [Mercenaria mercenaria]